MILHSLPGSFVRLVIALATLCIPNALATFEYLVDYASLKTKEIGEKLIDNEISRLGKDRSGAVIDMIKKIKSGQRDIYC